MPDKPVEILLFDFITDQLEPVAADNVLADLDLHDTVYQAFQRPRGYRISDAVGEMALQAGGMSLEEQNVKLQIVCFSRVMGKDQKARQPALLDAFALQTKMWLMLVTDPTLGGRVCNSVVKTGVRGYDVLSAHPYAVANISIIVNPNGGEDY